MDAYASLWRLAWPLILSNISVPLLGMVDVAVVGHLPEPRHLAATALGTMAVGVLYFLCGFLRTGTTALTSQASGAGDGVELRAALLRSLVLAVVLGGLLILARPLVVSLADRTFAPEPGAATGLAIYLHYRLLGAPAALGSFVLVGWLIGVQDTRRQLVLLVLTNGLNAVLAVAFVLGLGLEVKGVALATVVAEYVGLLLGFGLIAGRWQAQGGFPDRTLVFQAGRFRSLLVMNRDFFLRSLLLESVFVASTALGSRLGETVLAANAVLLTFFTFAAYGLDGFAFAIETMVGKAVGQRSPEALRSAVSAGFRMAAVLAVLLSLGFALFGAGLVALLTTLEPVRGEARHYLGYAALMPAVAVWAFVYDGVFFGAARGPELRNGMLAASLLFAALAFILVPPLGNHGLWLAFLGFLGARGLILAAIYRRADNGAAFARG